MADAKPQSFDDIVHRLGEFFKGLSLQQRALMLGGVALVGGTLWVFVALLGTPKYVTLYSGLRAEEAQGLAARLAAKNIPHQISPDGGTLLVPDDKLDAARLGPLLRDCRAARAWALSCSTRRTGRVRILLKRSTTSGRLKANWNALWEH